MSNARDSASPRSKEDGPVTPTNHSRSNTMDTNPSNNDMIHCQNNPYANYADSDPGSQIDEEGDDRNVIYVSGLIHSIEDTALYEIFCQFGQITHILRRFDTKLSGTQPCAPECVPQHAFVRYVSVEGAQRALQVAEVALGDRKLTVKQPERCPDGLSISELLGR